MDRERPQWRKSSRSGGSGGNCVEVARLSHAVAVRDSKRPDVPALAVSGRAWQRFTRSVTT